MFLQENFKAWCVSILANHVARRVSIAILCIIVSLLSEQSLQYLCVASNTCNMEWCAKILGLAVEMGAELSENFNHFDVAFITCNMQWGPSIRVAFIQQCLGKFGVLFYKQVIARLIVALFSVNPDTPQKTSLLFLVKFSLALDPLCSLHLLLYKKKEQKARTWV